MYKLEYGETLEYIHPDGTVQKFEQWTSYFSALAYPWTPEDEKLADSLVVPGHASTPGFIDPAYPVEGRFAAVS